MNKKTNVKPVHYDEREFDLKLKKQFEPNASQVYQMRVLKKCITDVLKRELEARVQSFDNKNDDKKDKNKGHNEEEATIDPTKMASMLVRDNKLFQQPKKYEKVYGEKDEGLFQWKFDIREEWHLRN